MRSRIISSIAVGTVALAASSLALASEIHDAAQTGELKKVKALLEATPDWVSRLDHHRQTALHIAAARGFERMAELLLADNAEVDAKDEYNQTPLHLAARDGHKDVAALLLRSKAEVNATNYNGETPLYKAVGANRKAVARLLLASKAEVDLKTINNGITALHTAAAGGYQDMVRRVASASMRGP